jgi:hypothetical protein
MSVPFFLDDGIVAGSDDAVAWFCERLQHELASIGLAFNLTKCVVTPAAGAESFADASSFTGWQWNTSRNVKVLGAAVGDEVYCSNLVSKRRKKAADVLRALRSLNDSQASLLLLRSCSSFAKLLYCTRTCPSAAIEIELSRFDSDVRVCFCEALRLDLDDEEWSQAQWASKLGGLGLRSCKDHARAAFVASTASTLELQCLIWPSLSSEDVWNEPVVRQSVADLPPFFPPDVAASVCLGGRVTKGFVPCH